MSRKKLDKREGEIESFDPPEEERRDYLKTVGALVAGLVVGGAAAWLAKPPVTVEVPGVTVTAPGVTKTVTKTTTITPPPATVTVAPEDTVWAGVMERGKIRVGSSPDWPPYEYLDPETGEIIGFEVELMEMVAERLGFEVEWKEMGFDLIIPEVKDKAIDLGVSGFSIYPPRLEVIQYTMPHSITEGQIVMLKSRRDELGITEIEFFVDHPLKKLDELGITCGTGVGTTQEAELDEQAPGALRTYDDFWAALEAMKLGAIDSVYAETPVTSDWILAAEKAGEEPIVVIFRRPYYPVAFVAHLDSDILVAKITGALADITAEGLLDELKAKWRC
jgi:ABC-type amino acid transport substrate-binding protein